MERLTCRTCGIGLTDAGGCDLCRDFKARQIAVHGELVGDDPVELVEAVDEAVKAIRHQVRRLRGEQRKTEGYDARLSSEASKLAIAAARLLDTARKLYQQGDEQLATLSFPERLNLFQEWFGSLPIEMQRKVLGRLSRHALPGAVTVFPPKTPTEVQ